MLVIKVHEGPGERDGKILWVFFFHLIEEKTGLTAFPEAIQGSGSGDFALP